MEASDPSDSKDVDLKKVSSFEDLIKVVGSRGRWNVLLFFLCAYSTFVSPLQTLPYQFLGATPDHWCEVEPLIKANWTDEQILTVAIPVSNKTGKSKPESCRMYNYSYTELAELGFEESLNSPLTTDEKGTIPCYSRSFNLSQYQSTVTTEWDLVCERRAIYATTQAAVQVGKLLGYLILGYFIDRFGRRPVVLISSLLTAVSGFLAAGSPNIAIYIILKIVITIMTSGMYLGCFVIVMETCSAKDRSFVGSLFVMPWAFGYMVIPGIAYFIRTWRWLQVANTLPALVLVMYYWLLPESPRWLILKGRYDEALIELTKAAKMNRVTLPPDTELLVAMKKIGNTDEKAQEVELSIRARAVNCFLDVFGLLINTDLLGRALTVFFCWFAAAMVYYGVALNGTNLSANLYMYIFLGGLLEVPSYVLLWPAIAYIGRRFTLFLLYFICGVSILLVMLLMLFVPGVPVALTVFLSLVGKVAITAAFHLIWMFTAELFPTAYRSLTVGQASFCARIGSISSPYINDILGELIVWAPSATFGVVSLVAAGLSLLLPETKNLCLSDNSPNDRQNKSAEGVSNVSYVAESQHKKEGVAIS